MSDLTLDTARARYLSDLQRTHPLFNDQMSDILSLLRSLLNEEIPPIRSALDAVRADYVGCLRKQYGTLDRHVLELATACTHLYAPALGLTTPGSISSD
jgi:hypothetical protein